VKFDSPTSGSGSSAAAQTGPSNRHGVLGVGSGAALYIGSLIGPGVLLVPALAVQAAGPASLISWGALLLLSAPLALTFAALGIRMPVSGGVAEYARAGFGATAGLLTGGWFLTAVLIGAPTVSMMGGFYVADLTGSGTGVAAFVGLSIFLVVLFGNALGLRVSARLQLLAASVLTLLISTAVLTALPARGLTHWSPFAPHGWWAIGTAANLLIWLFVGWEAVAQLAGDFRHPRSQLPRAMALAFGVVTILYSGLALASVGVGISARSRVPLADLMSIGLGDAGRRATTVLAVALTMATMNVYVASASKLAATLAASGVLPEWLAKDKQRSIPRRPLVVIGAIGIVLLLGIAIGLTNTTQLIRATSACFVAVYVAATSSAVRILRGRARSAAVISGALIFAIAIFSKGYLLVPAVAAVGFASLRRFSARSLGPG
jgi:amino acid efflux transporter